MYIGYVEWEQLTDIRFISLLLAETILWTALYASKFSYFMYINVKWIPMHISVLVFDINTWIAQMDL